MKKVLFLLVLLVTVSAYSQQKIFEKEVSKISKEIENITKIQKDSLKTKVAKIQTRLDQGKITKTTAIRMKPIRFSNGLKFEKPADVYFCSEIS